MIRRHRVALLVALALALSWAPSNARAHANLVRSEPAAGASLATTPVELRLEFSEALDPSFTRVQLFDSHNVMVNVGPGVIDRARPTILRLPVQPLPNDSYTALWRTRSAVDGHITEGSIPFGIGVAVDAAALLPPVGAPRPATALPPAPDAAVRWLVLLAAALAFGGPAFGLFVWRPAWHTERAQMRSAGQNPVAADDRMTAAIRRLMWGGCMLFAAANVAQLLGQAASAANVPVWQAVGMPVWNLLAGRWGRLWLARMALTAAVALLARRLPACASGPARPWWAALLLAGGVLFTLSLNAHGAAVEQGAVWAVLADWLHLVAMVSWLGGLVPLLLAVRWFKQDGHNGSRSMPISSLVARFSTLAFIAITTLALTGAYSAIIHIGSPALLITTTYGRVLILKLVVFGIMLVLGAFNSFVLAPDLVRRGSQTATAFSRTLPVELVGGALVLLAVGVMTAVAPSRTAWEAELQSGNTASTVEGDVGLTLRVVPSLVGANALAVDVSDPRPGGGTSSPQVLLRLTRPAIDIAPLQVEATPAPGDSPIRRYTAQGSYFASGGRWQVEVVVRRSGLDDVRHTFPVDIVRTLADRAAAPLPGLSGGPVPTSPESVAAGRKLYEQHCQVCHGASGRGDGPSAKNLYPAPADMHVHVPLHPDADLYQYIRKGIPETAMPSFAEKLTNEELWDLVNYLKSTYGKG